LDGGLGRDVGLDVVQLLGEGVLNEGVLGGTGKLRGVLGPEGLLSNH